MSSSLSRDPGDLWRDVRVRDCDCDLTNRDTKAIQQANKIDTLRTATATATASTSTPPTPPEDVDGCAVCGGRPRGRGRSPTASWRTPGTCPGPARRRSSPRQQRPVWTGVVGSANGAQLSRPTGGGHAARIDATGGVTERLAFSTSPTARDDPSVAPLWAPLATTWSIARIPARGGSNSCTG